MLKEKSMCQASKTFRSTVHTKNVYFLSENSWHLSYKIFTFTYDHAGVSYTSKRARQMYFYFLHSNDWCNRVYEIYKCFT